jgi:hypothetical protein
LYAMLQGQLAEGGWRGRDFPLLPPLP